MTEPVRDPMFDELRKRLIRAEARLARIEGAALAARMDEGLWYISQTAVEEYAQQALRKLLNVIETRG